MTDCILSSKEVPFEPTKRCAKCTGTVVRVSAFCDECLSKLINWSDRRTDFYVDGGLK